jgi:8-oxo-dGTP pyrophosphatase MutT (NUDIX family)
LREETGFEAQDWLHLFTLTPSPGISSERAPCFVAWNLTQEGQRPDPTEDLRLRRVPFRGAVAAAADGEIVDATSVACLLTLQSRLVAGTLPPDLAQQLQSPE